MTHTGKIEGILLTIPERFFRDYPGGEKQFRKIIEGLNVTDSYKWGNTCGSGVPRLPVAWCYLVFKGAVQYRCDIASFEKNSSKEFNDGGIIRVFRNKNWIWLQGPVVSAPYNIPQLGFQGFRYTSYIF